VASGGRQLIVRGQCRRSGRSGAVSTDILVADCSVLSRGRSRRSRNVIFQDFMKVLVKVGVLRQTLATGIWGSDLGRGQQNLAFRPIAVQSSATETVQCVRARQLAGRLHLRPGLRHPSEAEAIRRLAVCSDGWSPPTSGRATMRLAPTRRPRGLSSTLKKRRNLDTLSTDG